MGRIREIGIRKRTRIRSIRRMKMGKISDRENKGTASKESGYNEYFHVLDSITSYGLKSQILWSGSMAT